MRIQVGGYRGTEILWAEIDDEDAQVIEGLKWTTVNSPHTTYAITKTGGINQKLHRVVMGLVPGDKEHVNHKNGNGLDNRKANLEICDAIYNNQSIRKVNSTRNIGSVFYLPNLRGTKKYRAKITINKKLHVKYFATEPEGRAWIQELIKEHFGEEVTSNQ